MPQNKIYKNYLIEIVKSFFLVLFGFSIIAVTVRAVSFLDLVVESGYTLSIYFQYSLLNVFGIAPKFIPFSFLIAVSLFIIRHIKDSEFIILWSSGVKKIDLVHKLFLISFIFLILNLIFSSILTPFALNKSRQLLSNGDFNFFLPTVKTQQFSDSFEGFTFVVEEKINNEIRNVFLHDKGRNLNNLSSNSNEITETVITAENGLIENKKMFLFNGEVISTDKDLNSEIMKFDQLDIDLSNLKTTTIKEPKIQELSSLKLFSCFSNKLDTENFCNKSFNKEIVSVLNRRFIIPLYIPVLSLCCSFLLIRSKERYLNKFSIFFYSFVILLFTELAVRYTGLNKFIMMSFILIPFLLSLIFYFFMFHKFNKENKKI